MNKQIDKNTMIAELLKLKPQAAQLLMSKGMHCLGCSIASAETIAQAAEVHGFNADKLVEEINQL